MSFLQSCPGGPGGCRKPEAFCEAVLPELWQTSSNARGLSVSLSLSGASKDSYFKAFWAHRPYYIRLLGYFDAKGYG